MGISARRDDRRGSTIRDGVVASARVVCAIRGHAADLLIARNLVEQMRHHRCITCVTAGDLDGSDFQRLLINADVDLAPNAPFWAAMLARVSLAFPFNLDAGAIHCPAVVCLQTKRRNKQVQRALRAAIRNVRRKCLLAAADGAEVRHVPIESC
jgi:hypothetical protein